MDRLKHADLLTDVVNWFPVLRAARATALDQEDVEHHLGVSKSTGYRVTRRLCDRGLMVESDGTFTLTEFGERTTEAAATFETAVFGALPTTPRNRDRLTELIGLTPALRELDDGSVDRRDLEQRLDEKTGGRYVRTSPGDVVVDELDSFETTVRTTSLLAPVLESMGETRPPLPIEAFSDATVTSVDGGDAYGQVDRFIALVEETDTLRGIDLNSIAPMYIEEITRLVLNGMELEMISRPDVVEDTADKFPYACAKLCVNGNVKPLVHDELPFGLAVFDDHVGIGVQDPGERRLRTFIDSDSPAVLEWAAAVFDAYRDESIRLEQYSKKALREALPNQELSTGT